MPALLDSYAGPCVPAIGLASFLNFSLLIVVSPILKNVWPKSRLAWWGAVIFSGLAAAGFWAMLYQGTGFNPDLGGWCLLLAPVLNFIGLLLARPQWLERKQLVAGDRL